MVLFREATNVGAEMSVVEGAWVLEEVVIVPVFFLRRFISCPLSSSEELESEEAGGGVAARLRILDLPVRFLNRETGGRDVTTSGEVVEAILCFWRRAWGFVRERLYSVLWTWSAEEAEILFSGRLTNRCGLVWRNQAEIKRQQITTVNARSGAIATKS